MDTSQLMGLAEAISFHVGSWEDFGYADPPAPDSATIPPLGQRSAHAIKARRAAVQEIDQLTAELQQLRAQLVSEGRQDEDIRMGRPIPAIPTPAAEVDAQPTPPRCSDHHASGVTNCVLATGHDGFHHNGSGLTWKNRPGPNAAPGSSFGWSTPPALDGYGYTLPEDYLRGGKQ